MAKSDPTIAAPITPRPTVALPVGQKLAPKFAASASACLPIESPRRMGAASAAVLIVVSDVWMIAAVLTPRTLIQVSAATEATAKMRWRDSPTATSPIGGGRCTVVPRNTSGVRPGQNTAGNRANATAPAAMGPVWVTTKSVPTDKDPHNREDP